MGDLPITDLRLRCDITQTEQISKPTDWALAARVFRRTAVAIAAVFFGVISLLVQFTAAGAASPGGNPNNPTYWEALYSLPAGSCVKFDPPNTENTSGYLDDGGKAVVLNSGSWRLLVVKGGAVDIGEGNGNVVYGFPTAGELYYSPNNGGGNVPQVSHWIICVAEPTTTTTTTVPPSTTTTTVPPPTTTSTVPVEVLGATTTSIPSEVLGATTTIVPSEVLGATQTAAETSLAFTGSDLIRLLLAAASLIGSGITALQARRRY
ncbi:MAG: hypothetical protein WD029_07955 [Microthrixaceae bacterium]